MHKKVQLQRCLIYFFINVYSHLGYVSTTESVTVEFNPTGFDPAQITKCKAYVKDAPENNCEVNQQPYQCIIDTLKPATNFTIKKEVCLTSQSSCQEIGAETKMWTLPTGRMFFISNQNTVLINHI